MTEVAHQTFAARVTPKRLKAVEDSDCERDPDGLVSDRQIERDCEQLRRQQVADEPVLLSSNGSEPVKSIAETASEARAWAFKAMSAAQVKTIEFEVDDE